STFIGGTTNDYGNSIAVDATGRAYIAGVTNSADFPVTAGAFQSAFRGGQSAYLSVLSADGASLAYSSLYGGAGGASAMFVGLDAGGRIVVGGSAGTGLPTTTGAYMTSLGVGSAAFVARFDIAAQGASQLLAASYYGAAAPQGNSLATGNYAYTLALDAAGTPWLTGQAYTTNLPVTANAARPSPTAMTSNCAPGSVPLNSFAYVAHLSADFKSLLYASYLSGGNGGPATCAEYGHGLAFDAAGNVYVGGSTSSLSYPTTAGTVQPTSPANSGFDGYAGFVTKLKPDGSAILWSTYLGGDRGRTYLSGLATDSGAGLWVYAGSAGGSNFPISTDALQKTHGGGTFDAAFVKLDSAGGTLVYSTLMGGAGDDSVAGFAVDSSGTAYVAGTTTSGNFPVTSNAFQAALTTPAYDGSDWFFSILGGGTVGRLSTASAGNTGDLTLTLDGAGFVDGAGCALSNSARTLAAGTATPSADGNQLVCQFALAGAATGKYDVVVTLPDGTSLRKPASFDIVSGGQPEVWATVVGRPKIRVGVPTRFTVSVGNSGNVDAWFTVLHVVVNSDMTYTLPGAVRPLGSASGVDYQKRLTTADVDSGLRYFSYVVPLIPAGKTLSLPLDLTSLGAQTWIVSASTDAPWFEDRASADAALRAAAGGAAPPASCQANSGKPYIENCLGQWVERISVEGSSTTSTLVDSGGEQIRTNPWDKSAYAKQFAQGLLDALAASTGATAAPTVRLPTLTAAGSPVVGLQASALFLADVAFDGAQGAGLVGAARAQVLANGRKQPQTFGCLRLVSVTPTLDWRETYRGSCIGGVRTIDEEADYQGADFLGQRCAGVEKRRHTEACDDTPIPSYCKTTRRAPATQAGRAGALAAGTGGSTCGGSGGSIDPNDKSGPIGDGSASHFVRAKAPLSYQVAFENQPTASLPAADVVVTDQLDPAKVDLSTLSLGAISFGNITVDVPPGLQSFATVQPIDATMSVRIQGSLNPATGLLKWTLSTIDPATRLPPSDPTLGFLPPDTDGRKGQGQVIFNVMPRSGVADGTAISNQASIVFDANPAILTPTWVNTLDATIPASKVQSLTPRPATMSFDVAWSGSDSGSGISTYSVYVSDNGGTFSPWKVDVAATTATYDGASGHTYGFYVRATDGAGNTEAAKSAAEASLAVNGAFGDPTVGTSSGGGGCTIGADTHRDASLPLLAILAAALLLIARRRAATKRRREED
ncbi:MAG: SBBP repeat-containing protein, partial [Caldimonas sp.]